MPEDEETKRTGENVAQAASGQVVCVEEPESGHRALLGCPVRSEQRIAHGLTVLLPSFSRSPGGPEPRIPPEPPARLCFRREAVEDLLPSSTDIRHGMADVAAIKQKLSILGAVVAEVNQFNGQTKASLSTWSPTCGTGTRRNSRPPVQMRTKPSPGTCVGRCPTTRPQLSLLARRKRSRHH
ncbi:hypothetical protein DFJ74DRAFT_676945 [Hyaloraphidium curvatum]|nr:hypothetical protein DFJ74DRAFT_676945 [Hyaloraphidium curvatum]